MVGHAWLHPNKSGTLKSNLSLVTFSMEINIWHSMLPLRDNGDKRILQSD